MKTILRKWLVGLSCGALTLATLQADEALRHVQQSLRDQGFYFGAVDGAPGDETNQAIRRYQIRNGLPVSGSLDEETRASIEKNGAEVPPVSGSATRPSAVRPTPTANPTYRRPTVQSVPEEIEPRDPTPRATPAPRARASASARPDLQVDSDAPPPPTGEVGGMPRNSVLPSGRLSTLLEETPYEFAPPPVQADVVRRAQGFLTRQGFFDGTINGATSGLLAEALTNFQAYHRLRKTARLDVGTLGTMRLLPGRQAVAPRDRSDDDDEEQPRRGPNIIFEGRIVR